MSQELISTLPAPGPLLRRHPSKVKRPDLTDMVIFRENADIYAVASEAESD